MHAQYSAGADELVILHGNKSSPWEGSFVNPFSSDVIGHTMYITNHLQGIKRLRFARMQHAFHTHFAPRFLYVYKAFHVCLHLVCVFLHSALLHVCPRGNAFLNPKYAWSCSPLVWTQWPNDTGGKTRYNEEVVELVQGGVRWPNDFGLELHNMSYTACPQASLMSQPYVQSGKIWLVHGTTPGPRSSLYSLAKVP